MTTGARPRSRLAWRAAKALACAVGIAALIVAIAVAGLMVSLNTPIVRRVVTAQVNKRVFAPLFRGRLVIVSLGHLDPFGVAEVSVRLEDPAGRPLIVADGVQSRFATLTLLRTLVFGRRGLVIDLPETTIRNADVRLDMDDAGLALANAFLPGPRRPIRSPRPTDPVSTSMRHAFTSSTHGRTGP